MRKSNKRIFACDFETTVYKGQTYTEVWASACCELFTNVVNIFHSIDEQFNYFFDLDDDLILYYHNLRFDGEFILYHIANTLGFTNAYIQSDENDVNTIVLKKKSEMRNREFTYIISEFGQWYKVLIKNKGHYIEIRDSLKILPFSLDDISKSFETKHKKLNMQYTGHRFAGCEITDAEKKYIENDVLVLKEALEIVFTQGHDKLTIGSCCMSEYREIMGNYTLVKLMPNLYKVEIDENIHGSPSAGEWLRKSYRGGWCYVSPRYQGKSIASGVTLDVNSLYPSMMHSESGNKFPVEYPTFWAGNFIPPEAKGKHKYYFVRIRTRFYLKENKLPCIQIKNTFRYRATEYLTTSDVFNSATKTYADEYFDINGDLQPATVELTLTETDFELIQDHYILKDLEIIDGCYFRAVRGIFDNYIDKYREIKIKSAGAARTLAKLYLNNLYGQLSKGINDSFKVMQLLDGGKIGWVTVEHTRISRAGYIAIGSAITSYARNFTIRAAQLNYDNFIYADTDSIHCAGCLEDIKGVKLHDSAFCAWKLESVWDYGVFIRQKTYIERDIKTKDKEIENAQEQLKAGEITKDDYKILINKAGYNVKCAGMPQKSKDLFLDAVGGMSQASARWGEFSTDEQAFFSYKKYKISDFKVGLVVPGKLLPKRITGGIVLNDSVYEIRPK